jgi:hypothetical protein
MPKAFFTTIKTLDVNANSDTVSIHGNNDKGQPVTATLPMAAFTRVAAEARRGNLMKHRLAAGSLEKRGQIIECVPLDSRTFHVARVDMSQTPFLALIFDSGYESEIAFRLDVDAARRMAQQLLDECGRSKSENSGPAN